MAHWHERIAAVHRANSFEATGSFGATDRREDELVVEYLDLMREMERLPARVRLVGRMAREGWNNQEIAANCGTSMRTVARDRNAFREWLLYSTRGLA